MSADQIGKTVLELKVKNHPGVMSHVCGMFARRAYNVEGILCLPPVDESEYSRIWLLVDVGEKLDQVIRQTRKLVDVVEVNQHPNLDHTVFVKLEDLFTGSTGAE